MEKNNLSKLTPEEKEIINGQITIEEIIENSVKDLPTFLFYRAVLLVFWGTDNSSTTKAVLVPTFFFYYSNYFCETKTHRMYIHMTCTYIYEYWYKVQIKIANKIQQCLKTKLIHYDQVFTTVIQEWFNILKSNRIYEYLLKFLIHYVIKQG